MATVTAGFNNSNERLAQDLLVRYGPTLLVMFGQTTPYKRFVKIDVESWQPIRYHLK